MNLLDVKLTITLPYDRPDSNGIVFTKEAVMSAVKNLSESLPILIDNQGCSRVVGNTTDYLVSWDSNTQTCYITANGKLYKGGIKGVVNKYSGNEINDFNIRAFSVLSDVD